MTKSSEFIPKAALICGASGGLGPVLAHTLQARGMIVRGTMRDPSKSTLSDIEMLAMDVLDEQSVRDCMAAAKRAMGSVDVVINCVNDFALGSVEETTAHDPIPIADGAPYVDYEAEMVAVIGKRGKYISEADAKDYVFGYCVGNDVTERHWQHRVQQWTLGKSFDGHAPIGPWITTADEIADPHALDISLSVNGETRQSSNTRHLVFNLWQQISHLSHAMTLEPGDLIFTGTPGGVGAAMDPRQFLQPGDVVRVDIGTLGHIEGTMASENAAEWSA